MSNLFSLETSFCKELRDRSKTKLRFLSQCLLSVRVPSEIHHNPKVSDLFLCVHGKLMYKLVTVSQGLFICVYRTVSRKFQALVIFCLLTGYAVHSPICRETEVYLVIGKSTPKYLLSWKLIQLVCHSPVFNKLSRMIIKSQIIVRRQP